MSNVNTINFNTPFLQGVPNSRISPEWIRLFAAIVTIIDLPDSSPSDGAVRGMIRNLQLMVEQLDAQSQRRQSLPALLQSDTQVVQRQTAPSANSVAVMDDVTTNLTMYPLWSNGTAGQRAPRTSSTAWTFNPSTGQMTATILAATGAITAGTTVTAGGSITAKNATAIPAGGTAGAGLMVSSTTNFGVFFGSGVPSLSAAKGSLYLRSDGTTTNNRAYVNTDSGTTWTALTTAA